MPNLRRALLLGLRCEAEDEASWLEVTVLWLALTLVWTLGGDEASEASFSSIFANNRSGHIEYVVVRLLSLSLLLLLLSLSPSHEQTVCKS